MLDAAGWKRGADGIREKDGRKLKLLFQTSINSVRQKVQSIYKQSCAKAGIELELKGVTAAVFFSSDVANPDTYGRFLADLQMYAVAGRLPDPDSFMQWMVSWQASTKANKWLGLNRGRWASDEYDAAYRASEFELDPVKRAALMIRMNDLVCNDHALIPVVYRPTVHGLARNARRAGVGLGRLAERPRRLVPRGGVSRQRRASVGNYLLRRLLIALPSLLGISVVLFTVLALAPGDPFSEMALNPNVPPEVARPTCGSSSASTTRSGSATSAGCSRCCTATGASRSSAGSTSTS